jgi:glyoxylase-like metal-dependent hydrolase (beta-lactamase superfamily II)
MRRILPSLYTFTGLVVGRVYMIEDPDGLTIIDTSLSFAPRRILKQIAGLGYAPVDVKRILITHAHPDHVGGLHELQKATGADVYASEPERGVIQEGQPVVGPPKEKLSGIVKYLPLPKATFPSTLVARVLRDGDVLAEVMGGLQVVATPGHAPGHVAFWQPERKVLFCGDVMMALWPRRLTLPFRMVTVDMGENIRSLQHLADLDPQVLCLGHGIPITRNTSELIRSFARKVDVSS